MEISDEQRMQVECQRLPPSWQGNGSDADVEVDHHLWPSKDGPLPIFLKVLVVLPHSCFFFF